MPSERSERIMSHAARRAAGSKPVVGSSRKTSSGLPTSATPRSSRRFWPPESVLTRASRFSPARRARSPRRRHAGSRSSPRRAVRLGTVSSGLSSDCWSTTPIRSRSARGRIARIVTEHGRRRPRHVRDSPRGSRPWSSCRLRSARAGRRPHPRRPEADTAKRFDLAVGLRSSDTSIAFGTAGDDMRAVALGRVARVPTLRYVVVDVFTDTALAGNQLAVFTDARELDAGDHAGARAGDRLLGDDVRSSRRGRGHGARTHLHALRRAAIRRPSDPRHGLGARAAAPACA